MGNTSDKPGRRIWVVDDGDAKVAKIGCEGATEEVTVGL